MKKLLSILPWLSSLLFAQSPSFYPVEYWRVSGKGMAFNVEAYDINKDGKKDIIVGNWNNTYVYYGGKGVLDTTVDVTYTGRMLAVCDYNGDGFKDLITMHFTNYDSTPGRTDYDGEILFYYGSDTTTLEIDTIPDYSIQLPTQYPTRDEFAAGVGRPGVEYGDFNKDGKADIVISSLRALPDGVGVVYMYMGNQIPPDTATFKIRGRSFVLGKPPIDFYGNYFQVGDINDDGYSDLLLSFHVSTVPPNSKDSLDALDVYLGSKDFDFLENGESVRYESKLKTQNNSYGWVKKEFSLADINGDGIPDLIVCQYYKDFTDHVHFGSINGIDTIPSFYITDPDTTNSDVIVGGMCHDIGDFNNDGYNDFILKESYIKSFSLHLGGPKLSNDNPYGLRGLLESCTAFPRKAIDCSDQNGDGTKDFVAIAPCGQSADGYVLIFLGDPTIVTEINKNERKAPFEFKLNQNYPNPFNPTTMISYQITAKSFVTLKIYDTLGRYITTLVSEEKQAGKYQWGFDASKYNLSSGAYFCQLKTKETASSKIKMLYIK